MIEWKVARRIAAGIACLAMAPFAAVVWVAPAVAQTSATVRIVRVTLLAEAADESVFSVDFSPGPGSYSAVSTDPSRPGLVLLRTARAPEMPDLRTYRGLVSEINFETTDSGLVLRFGVRAPSKVSVAPGGARTLLVTVKRLSGAEAIGSRPVDSEGEDVVPATGLPPALQPFPGEDGYELVMLKYADVSEIVGLLTDGVTVKPNNVFIRREPGFGSVGSNTTTTYSSSQGQVAQEEKPLGQSVDSSLAIDRRLNAIWIKGSAERIARIKDQIAMIDIPVDSVILETQFVELTEQGSRALGIDFANASGQIASGSIQTGNFLPFGYDAKTVLGSGQVQAAIYAQIQKGQGRIVSKPRIAAQSGSTAKIITGDAIPILTAITLSGVNGVSQQVQYVNVGVTLQIAPRVSSDGYVTSHLYAVVSSVTGTSQGYPTISQREAETSASVRDGETFVIGGLTQENDLTNRSKIPLLGDIPLIGRAFRTDRTTKSNTELYIVITPHIVRHRRFEQVNPDGSLLTPSVSPVRIAPPNVPRGSPLDPAGR